MKRHLNCTALSSQEIDAFVRDFLSVVQRLPSCISSLHALSRRPLPSTCSELQIFCSANEAAFLQLRRSGAGGGGLATISQLLLLLARLAEN